jgi:rsbT co-antagonist protein RsbR
MALVESLVVQNALSETASVVLLAIRRTLARHVISAGAGAVDFMEEALEGASISCMRRLSQEVRRITEHHDWVFNHLPAMMHSIDAEGKLALVNERWLETLGYRREEVVGRRSTDFLTAESARYAREVVLPEYFKTGRCDNVQYQFVRKDGAIMEIMLSAIAAIDLHGNKVSRAVLIDITDWMASQRDAQQATAQEETIRIQRELLRAISTPLVPLGDGILLMPLVGNIDSTRAEQIMGVLLEGVVAHAAEIAILDVTGVPSMDAAVAEALMGATKAVGLLGAGVILTGIGPAAARTLVELGVDLTAMTTKSTLRAGLATARKRMARRV